MDTIKKTDDKSIDPDTVIEQLGGCGKYQMRMTVIVHLMKTVICFSATNLLISTKTPTWWCKDDLNLNNVSYNTNITNPDYDNKMSCKTRNGTKCTTILYDESITTLVSEFNLICDLDFIPSTIGSLQLVGQLIGNIAAGQLADLIGRKRPFFLSMLIVLIFHTVGFFSVSWEMFAVSTIFNGISQGFFFTIQYNLLSEFTLAKWRVWVVGFPSWQLQTSIHTLLAWLLHDWKYLQLVTALAAVPCLLAWWVIPESFRWYVAHERQDDAMDIMKSIATCNKHDAVYFGSGFENKIVSPKDDRKYTFIHLFKSKYLAKVTFLQMIVWFALGFVGYGIFFGIQKLSGNFYLNTLLFTLCAIPSKSIALWLQNRIGRRNTSIACFVLVAVAGLTVGILQTLDAAHKDIITNIMVYSANAGIGAAWSSVQTHTVELYPTVIRNIGFGTVGFVNGLASVLGPQLVYLEKFSAGLMYYVCGAVSVLCIFSLLALPETKDKGLIDKIDEIPNIKKHASIDIELSATSTDTDCHM